MASPMGAPVPLFLCDDWEQVVNAMPTFNSEGLVPAVAPEDLAALAMVDVSSGSSSESEEEEEAEEEESVFEATGEESGESVPWLRSRALRYMPDDNDAGAGQGGEDSPLVTRKGRSGLVPPGSVPIPGRSEASPSPPDVASASGPPEADPSCRLSGFKFVQKLLGSASDDQ